MKVREHLSLLVLILVTVAGPASASTFQRVGLEKLVRDSATVVEAEVLSVDSFWDAEGRIIVTEATVLVSDQLHGKAGSVIKVKTFGGTAGGYTVIAHGFPTFEKSNKLLLFLKQDESNEKDLMRVTGYQQGQFKIVEGQGNEKVAESTVDGGAHFMGGTAAEKALPNRLSLADLKQQIREQSELIKIEKLNAEGESR